MCPVNAWSICGKLDRNGDYFLATGKLGKVRHGRTPSGGESFIFRGGFASTKVLASEGMTPYAYGM